MSVIQLQLDLWQQLFLAFDEAFDQTPVGLRLATAADAISQMADVLAARAEAFGVDWHRKLGDSPMTFRRWMG
ncbi:MAG: hypothetical protein WCD18_10180 [Thermosynechococcaceae cyanobacterium]